MDNEEIKLLRLHKQIIEKQEVLITILKSDIEKRDVIIKHQFVLIKDLNFKNLSQDFLTGDLKTHIQQLYSAINHYRLFL